MRLLLTLALLGLVVAAPATAAVKVPPGRAVDTSRPARGVGNGTAASCTSRALVARSRRRDHPFDCGPDPVTIGSTRPRRCVNTSRRVVLDGGGR